MASGETHALAAGLADVGVVQEPFGAVAVARVLERIWKAGGAPA